jgi:hypothetical protein
MPGILIVWPRARNDFPFFGAAVYAIAGPRPNISRDGRLVAHFHDFDQSPLIHAADVDDLDGQIDDDPVSR